MPDTSSFPERPLYDEQPPSTALQDPQIPYQIERARQALPVIEETWPWKVRVLVAYLHEHLFEENLTVEGARTACGLKDKNISAAFRKYLELAPRQYITHHRLEAAKRLLAQTRVPVTAVGLAVGFDSVSAFDKTFKQQEGCTPSEYRTQQDRKTSGENSGKNSGSDLQ